VAVKVLK